MPGGLFVGSVRVKKRREAMKKNLLFFAIALLIVIALIVGSRLMAAEEKAADVSLTGTVVDMHCYVTHGIHDAKHTACANACIARGVPAGFLTDDGTLYVLFDEKPFSVKDKVAGLADVPATLTGTPVVRGGIKGIQIKSIERKNAEK
jgi:type 1 fimbria pilin